jgi:hypothetical protein
MAAYVLAGIGLPLRLVEASQVESGWWFRLGDMGRHLLRGQEAPKLEHEFHQTLVMQPNGELVIFRQGLTPALIGKLTRFAAWKTIGSACTMELTAESVYRGLETGLTQDEIQRLLEQHGPARFPPMFSIRCNAGRASASESPCTLRRPYSIANAADLEAAFARGLISTR